MPASPSLPSEGRGKWKRRKRVTRNQHQQSKRQDDGEEEDDVVFHDRDDSDYMQTATAADPDSNSREILSGEGVRVSDFPLVMRREVIRPHVTVTRIVELESSGGSSRVLVVPNLENVSHGQLQVVSAVAAAVESNQERSDGGNSVGFVVSQPRITKGKGVLKKFGSRAHIVPMHSDWFWPATINRFERQAVPQFFSGKSLDHTPEKYMEIRNCIVAKYMENPEKRLTVIDCEGLVSGIGNEDLSRIVQFLEHWGVINYCAASTNGYSWNSGSSLREDTTGEVHVPSAALKSIDCLIKFDKAKCRLKAADVYSYLSYQDDDLPDLDDRLQGCLFVNHCTFCSQPLSRLIYQSKKEVNIMLCSDCFHDGSFVAYHSSLDFVKVDRTKDLGDIDGEIWTDEETLLLLEAMEIFSENWNEIAEHVGTKSKVQCILHFLRLSMEDGLLENIDVPSLSKLSFPTNEVQHGQPHLSSNGSCPQEVDSKSSLPFANSGNPVMALVALLAWAVGPRVAAACAHASLAALTDDNRMNVQTLCSRGEGFQWEASNSDQHKEGYSHGSMGENEEAVPPLTAEKVEFAARAGLAAAATKTKLFADHEEREIQRLSANIINHQIKRLELKLKQFAELETSLVRDCEQVEKTRQRFSAERLCLLSALVGSTGVSSQMNLSGAGPSLVNNNIPQRQHMSLSTSQPNISGYSSSQQRHSHVSIMQCGQLQPLMFQQGQSVPLSAIQSSSTAPSNSAFIASGNSQSGLNQMLRSMSGQNSALG